MAETRTILLEEKLISDVCKKQKIDQLPDNLLWKYAFCVGYKPASPIDAHTKAIMRGLIEHYKSNPAHKVELFLSVKEEGALEALLDVQEKGAYVNKEYIRWLVEQGVIVTYSAEYSQGAEFKKASEIFERLMAPKLANLGDSASESTKESDALKKDIMAAKKRPKLKLLSDEVIKAHVIQDTKYVISWLADMAQQNFTVVLHEGFFNLMHYSVQHAEELGYQPHSLLLHKVDDKYFENKMVQKDIPREDVPREDIPENHPVIEQMVRNATKEMYGASDPVSAGLFYATALKALLFNNASAPVSIPTPEKKSQSRPSSVGSKSSFFAASKTPPKAFAAGLSPLSTDEFSSSSDEHTPDVTPVMSSANSSDDDHSPVTTPSSSPPREPIAQPASAIRGAMQLTVLAPPVSQPNALVQDVSSDAAQKCVFGKF